RNRLAGTGPTGRPPDLPGHLSEAAVGCRPGATCVTLCTDPSRLGHGTVRRRAGCTAVVARRVDLGLRAAAAGAWLRPAAALGPGAAGDQPGRGREPRLRRGAALHAQRGR